MYGIKVGRGAGMKLGALFGGVTLGGGGMEIGR